MPKKKPAPAQSMQRDPSFPFYAENWLTAETTLAMRPEELGAYINLLAFAWLSQPHPCTIPDNDAALAHVSKLGERWAEFGPAVKACFDPCEIEGRLREPHLYTIWLERKAYRDQQGENSRKRWESHGSSDDEPPKDRKRSRKRSTGSKSDRVGINSDDPKRILSVSVSSSVSDSVSEKETGEVSPSGSGSRSRDRARESESDGSGSGPRLPVKRDAGTWKPPYTLPQLQYRIDKVRQWKQTWEERHRKDKLFDEERFESEFESEFGMTWRYWCWVREKCEKHYASDTPDSPALRLVETK